MFVELIMEAVKSERLRYQVEIQVALAADNKTEVAVITHKMIAIRDLLDVMDKKLADAKPLTN